MSNANTQRMSQPHTVQMDRRKNVVITGVTDVSSFHETEIILRTDDALMVINGQNLHVGKLLLEDGKIDITGLIESISYENPHKSVRRFFSKRSPST